METKHTPGPYHVEDGALTKGNETPTGWFICAPSTVCDATAVAWVEKEADAHLFAASLDMLAALEAIERAPAWGAPERWEVTPAEVRQLSRAAIAKAKPLATDDTSCNEPTGEAVTEKDIPY